MAAKPSSADKRAVDEAEQRVEALRQEYETITTGVTGYEGRVRRCHDDLDSLDKKLTRLEGRLDDLIRRGGVVEGTVSGLERRFDDLAKRGSELRDDAEEIENTFDVLGGKLPWLRHEVTTGVAKAFAAAGGDDQEARPRRGRGAPRSTPDWVDDVARWLRDERHLTMQGIADVLSSHPYDLRSRSGDPIGVSYVQQVLERTRSVSGNGDYR